MLGEVRPRALLPVHDDEDAIDHRTGLAERLDGIDGRLAGRGDVLQHDDLLAVLEPPLDPVAGPVLLGPLADDDVRRVGRDARGGDERDGPERDAGQSRVVEPPCERLSDESQTVRVRLEQVLVDVVLECPP